ncbi:DUF3944 domain-containing protein [Clostridium tyrobutyricum]|jgi:uncharacterized protein YaaW (UPF0174 family)|uniref:Uncharacterized protein n=2 Tax=Clostridium tyrobutyricum TaxID=1519 RepID=W6N657_CLOTY|nr:DUF3944 domain-containing protein [Clostridium tyrobutyricum]AND85367.1 hypothetical protein CTK_C21190 [Clostridium tyrobutyricum]MBV4424149.1 DUF3944 domain-containing protein [Clostridium tyrobutyricum]MBV4435734.1 DUF3944 domain-containing protein [Clostridium tyrobutyricum]MBV4450640.1 DUF3944 domain-containing protein [Clostridium tyrobutyricum]CDL91640.1 conserved hypothetical protein [Clostridium tyrobutyricum DIVETGP]
MYRYDTDLEFLKYCSNEDLDLLVTYLIKDKDGNPRLTEELTYTDEYKLYSPNHKMYWQLIAAELQCFGANTFATLFRGGKGVLYKELLMDVCNKLKVNYNKNSSTEIIEMNLIMKILTDSIENMDSQQIKDIIKELKLKTTNYSKEALLAALQFAIKIGGFQSYEIAVIVANAVAKQLLKRGLSFTANATLTRAISIFAGPIGWIITGAWTLIDIGGPAYRVTIPSVVQVAYMRLKNKAQ